jgi:hypothetical protein
VSDPTIRLAGDAEDRAYEVEHWFSADRALVRFDGTYALVDRVVGEDANSFELSGQPASLSEQEILNPLVASVAAQGTTVTVSQDDVLTQPAPLEDTSLDETGEYAAAPNALRILKSASPMSPKTVEPRPGFCHCGTALTVAHVHADRPSLDKCWCGLYLAHPHSHVEAAQAGPAPRCWCGIPLTMPHDHASVIDPSEKCWCGIAKNLPHEHAAGPRST